MSPMYCIDFVLQLKRVPTSKPGQFAAIESENDTMTFATGTVTVRSLKDAYPRVAELRLYVLTRMAT